MHGDYGDLPVAAMRSSKRRLLALNQSRDFPTPGWHYYRAKPLFPIVSPAFCVGQVSPVS